MLEACASERVSASFRDPSGYVFWRDGRVFRAVDSSCSAVLRPLFESGAIPAWIADHFLVKTAFVEDPALLLNLISEHPGYQHFLEHEVIQQITCPYEWCISMLADAAVHTLDLQLRLLSLGCSLKDASAYNVQFVEGRPTFIDLSSIEHPGRLDVWFALGQFEQFFLFPLLLSCHHGWDLRSYFLASLNGRSVEQVARALGWFELSRPRSWMDITLPLFLNRAASRRRSANRSILSKAGTSSQPQAVNLRRLKKKVSRLAASYKPSGVWSKYASNCSYDEVSEEAKKASVRKFLEASKPPTILDLGCNTGDYSFLAAGTGAKVIAADSDHDAVEILYRRLRASPAAITPIVLDITNPSPAIGYLNRERSSFLDRLKADCVLALALIHHLTVSGNLSFPALCELFYQITNTFVVVEFVPPGDAMFQRLVQLRRNLFDNFTLEAFKAAFLERFQLLKEEPIANSCRTLLFFRKVA